LKKQLNDYERELSDRDVRLHDLEKQLKLFLDKNYELRDAVQEIRQLKEQIKLKDRNLEEIAQFASRNELTVHEVNDENEELRAKLGMDPKTPMTVEQLKSARLTRSESNQAVVQVLQKEVRSNVFIQRKKARLQSRFLIHSFDKCYFLIDRTS
jgi:hypothetical protein